MSANKGAPPAESTAGKVNAEVLKAVVDAYYARGVTAADRARDRAEKGYTISSAVAAALVAAGAFTKLDERPELVQALGLVSLSLWLLAALLYIWTVAVPLKFEKDPDWHSGLDFVKGVSQSVWAELLALKPRIVAALVVTVAAIAFTAATLVAATVDSGGAAPERARVALTPKTDGALRTLCTVPVADLYAIVDPDNLDDDVVQLKAPAGACRATETDLTVPGTAILAVEEVEEFPGFGHG
ncbi:MAG TPA: hypothetical protein VF063_04050 [Gaiellaceae bacterium]